MNFSTFLTTFAAVFLAEMGDKTQLATFGFAAEAPNKTLIFIAAAAALVCTSAIGVIAGAWVGKYIPAVYIKYGSGLLFIAIGLWTIIRD
jgi:putative Ca2+/H+ antiporter (TMEM165/GDT1 family)